MKRLWYIPVAGAVLAPLVTWFPMLAYRFPWTGLPRYQAAQGIDFWSAQAFWFVSLVCIAVLVGHEDRYLGWAVGFAGLTIFFRGATMDPTHSVMFAFGAIMLAAMRKAPTSAHPTIKSVLVAIGTFELLYVLQQQFLKYDFFWGPWFGGQLSELIQPLGTIGTVDGAAAYIAIIAPLMPPYLIPVALLAIWQGHSVSATLALAAGLLIKYRRRRAVMVALVACCLLVAYSSAFHKSLNPWSQHSEGRAAIWGFALKDWAQTDPIVGYGLGGWAAKIPAKQVKEQFSPTKELWREAHAEPLQWLCETGVIGLILLVMWLWTHRTMFKHPIWGPSLSALGVNSLVFFPLHVVQLSLLAVILVGLATSPTFQAVHNDA